MKYKLSLWIKCICFSICAASLLSSCASRRMIYTESPPQLNSINIIDRNGLAETISQKDRLSQYEQVNFLNPQPYQKVLRVFKRNEKGDISAVITGYHPNGLPKQYLEVVNNRAFGSYREWHQNGKPKLDAHIIGGAADIDSVAELSWLFDGCSKVWNEEGNLVASIPYLNGELEGTSLYYHPTGKIWKEIPYHKNLVEGLFTIYLDNGSVLQQTLYLQGKKEGQSIRFWPDRTIAFKENYHEDKILTGEYYSSKGDLLEKIANGSGRRVLFGRAEPSEIHEYKNGIQEGEIQVLDPEGKILHVVCTKNGIKDGEEIEYYLPSEVNGASIPKLSIHWSDGVIQGIVKTWYPSGTQESQREMANNVKNGLLTAWYKDGSVMLIEEYDHDKLIKGEYFMPGETLPVSTIASGRGIATLFDHHGNLVRKVPYSNGKPAPKKD